MAAGGSHPKELGRRASLAAAAVALVGVVLALTPEGSATAITVVDVSQLAGALIAANTCARTARGLTGRLRQTWTLLAAGCGAWFAGQAVWSWYEVVLRDEVPFPSLADIGYLGFYPLAGAAMLLMPAAARTASRLRSLCDGLIVVGCVLFASWATVLGPAIEAGRGSLVGALGLAYPIADVALVSLALTVASRTVGSSRSTVIFLGTGLAAIGFADSIFAYVTMQGAYVSGTIADLAWLGGFLLVAIAAWHGRANRSGRRSAHGDRPLLRSAFVCLPTLVVAYGQAHPTLAPVLALLGSAVFVLIVLRQLLTQAENGALNGQLGTKLDELTVTTERMRLAAAATQDAIWDVDLVADHVEWGDGVVSLFGYELRDVEPSVDWWIERVHEDDRERVHASFVVATDDPDRSAWSAEYRFRRADGDWADVSDRGFIVRDANGVAVRMVGAMMDVTERRRYEAGLRHQATHDSLTGLPNRALLLERLRSELTERFDSLPAVLFFDLDHFKWINDSYGHAAGDKLLVDLGARLLTAVRPDDLVVRYAGDEFVVLCPGIRDEAEAVLIAQRIQQAVTAPFVLGDREVRVSLSIGIAMASAGVQPDVLMQNADAALFEAKTRGRRQYAVYTDDLRGRARAAMVMTDELRHAIDHGQLSLAYQPIVRVSTGDVVGVEALLRWQRADGSFVPPADFIPLAEETGLIHELGAWVLEQACRDVGGWAIPQRDRRFKVSINVSPLQLREDLPQLVADAIAGSGLLPEQVCLEITEGAIMADPALAVRVLRRVRRLGVRLALDDFGTGQSSLLYLKQLPVNILKIDRSFIAGLGTNAGDDVIIAAVMGIARAADLRVVAEGVEEREQLDALAALGCDLVQGYLLGRPIPGPATEVLLAEWVSQPTVSAIRVDAAAF